MLNGHPANAGKSWSESDLEDLRSELKRGAPIAEIAVRLAREASEVEAKIEEMAAEHRS